MSKKKSALMLACTVGGVVSGLTAAAKAGTFVDNFNNGSVTNSDSIANFWTPYALTSSGTLGTVNTSNSSIVEPVGGPSTLSYTGPSTTQGGAVEDSNTSSEFNFLQNAELITMTAAPNTSLIPGTDYSSGSGLGAATTWLGVDGYSGSNFVIGSTSNRVVLALSNHNQPYFYIKNSGGTTLYNDQLFLTAPSSTELVTSINIYIDGTQQANDHLYINFGETLLNTVSGVTTTTNAFSLPYDVGTSGGSGHNDTQAQITSLATGFMGGGALGVEVQNNSTTSPNPIGVSISQITDIYPLTYTAAGSSDNFWLSGVAGITASLTNFNTSTGAATGFINGASVTFDDKTANGGHNGGVFTLSITASSGAGVYPSSTTVTGSTPYVFTGNGGIHGIGGLNLTGTSSLTLTNVSNTYSGATNISTGTLIAGAVNVLSPSSPIQISSGTLDVSGFNQSIPSLTMTGGTLKLGANTTTSIVLTDTGAATFAGALNLVGTPATLPDILMTYTSETGAFATNNLPTGEGLTYTGGMLQVVAVATGPASLTWVNATGNGQWDIASSANWNASGFTVPYSDTSNPTLGTGDNVAFTDSNGGAASYNVSIAATVHPTSITVTTNNAYTFNGSGGIAGPGGLTLSGTGSLKLSESNTYTGGTNVSSGTLIIGAVGALSPSTALTIGSTAAVVANNLSTGLTISSLSNLGKLDLGNNKLTITTASLTTINNEVASGFNGGTWNGSGATPEIFSSAAASDTTYLHALGVMQSGTGVFVKYTYYGDANLDGKVDASDYSVIDSSYALELSGPAISGWANGDFNYDGVVNGSDYTLIDNAFNSQGTQISTEVYATSTAQIAGSGASSAVPEPASLGLLGMGVFGMLGRRNRRHHSTGLVRANSTGLIRANFN